jgi:hypothetical protein
VSKLSVSSVTRSRSSAPTPPPRANSPPERDRDVSEVRAELRAHTQALNALRENQLEQGGAIADLRSEMRQGFTKVNAGMSLIVELLGRESGEDAPEP